LKPFVWNHAALMELWRFDLIHVEQALNTCHPHD